MASLFQLIAPIPMKAMMLFLGIQGDGSPQLAAEEKKMTASCAHRVRRTRPSPPSILKKSKVRVKWTVEMDRCAAHPDALNTLSASSTGNINVGCMSIEMKALVKLKEGLTDHSDRLSSWVGEDCCKWRGVGCNSTTGRVGSLNLRNS
ncbi:hypothetical protein ACLB2K_057746 [Fragaria x ananassa]